MPRVKRLVLDVLKPHRPSSLDFASAVAAAGQGYRVALTVVEVDEQTESVTVTIDADDIHFDAVEQRIRELGGSVHSIDAVEVVGEDVPG